MGIGKHVGDLGIWLIIPRSSTCRSTDVKRVGSARDGSDHVIVFCLVHVIRHVVCQVFGHVIELSQGRVGWLGFFEHMIDHLILSQGHVLLG